jgi:biopolymer transport protein ExbD
MIRVKKRNRKKAFDSEFDITPMIDVVLLLLIFFMVSARMAPQNRVVLPKALHGDMAAMHDAVVLVVRKGNADVALVSTPAGQVFSVEEDQQTAEIQEYIVNAMTNLQKKYVLIQAEPRVLTSQMMRVQSAAAGILPPDSEIMIAVEN